MTLLFTRIILVGPLVLLGLFVIPNSSAVTHSVHKRSAIHDIVFANPFKDLFIALRQRMQSTPNKTTESDENTLVLTKMIDAPPNVPSGCARGLKMDMSGKCREIVD